MEQLRHGQGRHCGIRFTGQFTSYRQFAMVAFMVIQVQLNRADGSLTVEAKSLGGENVALSKELSQQFNRKRGRLHFCASDPCLHEDLGDIHVSSFNWYSLEGYAEHLTVSALRSARKWAETPREAGLEEVRDSEDETHPGSTAEHGGDPGPVPEELAGTRLRQEQDSLLLAARKHGREVTKAQDPSSSWIPQRGKENPGKEAAGMQRQTKKSHIGGNRKARGRRARASTRRPRTERRSNTTVARRRATSDEPLAGPGAGRCRAHR